MCETQCKYDAMSDKTVFVTVGTTKFDNLITTVLSREVLEVVITMLFILHYIKSNLLEHFHVYNYYDDFRPCQRIITDI